MFVKKSRFFPSVLFINHLGNQLVKKGFSFSAHGPAMAQKNYGGAPFGTQTARLLYLHKTIISSYNYNTSRPPSNQI